MARSANQLNEVMKKLTAWAGIVLVPTLIAGIYGMNFDHIPELHWLLGYPLALALMAGSSLLLYLGFRKRGWL
jgi:magnesium transporter